MFESEHKLDFEVAEWIFPNWKMFRIGTVEGLWNSTDKCYQILAISNSKPGNGHFNDVLQWFEHSCIRDHKDLRICEVWNMRLASHLVGKEGFIYEDKNNLIKIYGKVPCKK